MHPPTNAPTLHAPLAAFQIRPRLRASLQHLGGGKRQPVLGPRRGRAHVRESAGMTRGRKERGTGIPGSVFGASRRW